jgi:hypothetical protein
VRVKVHQSVSRRQEKDEIEDDRSCPLGDNSLLFSSLPSFGKGTAAVGWWLLRFPWAGFLPSCEFAILSASIRA